MSKRAERKQRKQEKLKNDVRTGWIVAAVGLVFLVLGIIGIVLDVREYREYKNTKQTLKVPCLITSVDVRTVKDEYDSDITVYDAKLTYEAEGKTYSDEERFYDKVAKGDTREITVYRKENGEYSPVRTTDEVSLFYELILAGIGLLVGLGLLVAGSWVAVSSRRELKAK